MRIDGRLQDTTWDACLDDLGTRLKDIIDRHGPESVAFYFSTMESAGFRMAEALHAAIGTPAKFSPLTIDGTAKPLISDLVGGFMGLSGRTDLDNADFLMLVGVNPVVSHGHAISMPNPTGTVRDIARRGQVWVIDPRRTETARLATGSSGAAPQHRPRGAGVSGSRDSARRHEVRCAGSGYRRTRPPPSSRSRSSTPRAFADVPAEPS